MRQKRRKVDLSFLPFIKLTAAVIQGGDPHFQMFTYCNVDLPLELKGKCTLRHEHSDSGKREKKRENWRVW